MSLNLRREALNIYKKLHRTRLKIFQGDEYALSMTKQKINDEYKKNKHITDAGAIQELVNFAKEVEKEIRTTVVQIVEKKPGLYEARITPETEMMDNIPFGQPVDKSQFRPVKKCPGSPVKS